jgi:hypothetical protein
LKYENIPEFIREKIADTWLKEQLIKLYLKSPHKVQYLLARYGVKFLVNKKRSELQEFMRH